MYPTRKMPVTVLVFRKPMGWTDKLVAVRAGSLVHVDIVPVNATTPQDTLVCTSYMGERFSMSLSAKSAYDDKHHVALGIPTSDEEQQRIVSYLHDLVKNHISYNYADLVGSSLPYVVSSVVMQDVQSDDPRDIQSLFCSQAAVLTLRHCLNQAHPVHQALAHANSRCMLPNMLFHVLQPLCRSVSCEHLRDGVCVFTSTCKQV